MIDHYFEKHQTEDSKLTRKITKRLEKSPFLKNGEYLRTIILESLNFNDLKFSDKILGTGAFSQVFLGKNKKTQKLVAVKKIFKEKILLAGAEYEIINREVDIHSRLIHDNIIQLLSFLEDEKHFYIILDYCNFGTVFNIIKKSKGGLPECEAFRYFIQTANVVHFLHNCNLIHRDIKPENLLLDKNNNIKLCDFGWCVEASKGDRQTFCGTYEYMAPEVISEKPYGQSIDIWSLGVLLYELLHGYSPFRAKKGGADEYKQIFRNIIKYDFRIDRDLDEECRDLLYSMIYLI